MHKVTDNLWFGCGAACRTDEAMAVVHACKEPCHRRAVGYKEKSLPSNHAHYLSWEHGAHLYLNLIDPPIPLFKQESLVVFFDFVDRMIRHRPVLIHCNKGESRAPSLALLYATKRLGLFPCENYDAARTAFAEKFPYKPGGGIAKFLEEHWAEIGA